MFVLDSIFQLYFKETIDLQVTAGIMILSLEAAQRMLFKMIGHKATT
jgi:hypothetical protein